MEDWIKDLTVDMLPEGPARQIAEAVGVENLVRLAELFGGTTFYMPKTDSLIRPVRDARIKEEFSGYNTAELAKQYNVTESWVRQLCGPGKIKGQISFFDQ
ncbi:Mor transcription activator family protein [Harryflintia acetispora]|uniref:Mor transcription activator family protein n=1 Tax=Harryflintia acetispora TaxID=1849041 RepID=A0A9X8Y889_9FIRM|nr:Mor transcription activator family protein [Harryflintia acetispora]TCL43204.1 Mor transcription activator family protein [Harryflintia acetispora]